MTEFEINKKVAEKLGVTDDYISFKPLLKYSFDPCNDASQAWEIMMKYNICVTQGDDGFYDSFVGLYCECLTSFYYDDYKRHKKPLVAAMLVFLEI